MQVVCLLFAKNVKSFHFTWMLWFSHLMMRPFFAFMQKSLFIAGRTSMRRVPKIKNKTFFCTRDVCLFVSFNIVIGHLGRPYSTHTAPMPVRMGSVHAHILTKRSRAGFAVIRLELIEPGAATCVYNEAVF